MANVLAALMTILASLVAYIFIDFKKMVRQALAAHAKLMGTLQQIIDDHEHRITKLEDHDTK